VITVAEVDRLVVSDDAVAARLWPRLGPRVRSTYLADRDRWIGLRRTVEGGATLSASTLAAQRKVFAGWARAFGAAGRARPAQAAKRKAVAAAVATPQAATVPGVATSPPAAVTPLVAAPASAPAAVVKKSGGGAGAAVAGGVVLATLIALAARRKSA
jgi:hypothetical protein